MILVTLGTQDKSFQRLLKAIDKEIEKGNIKEKVIVQAGYTKYKSKNMEIFDLVPEEELEKLVKKCDLLITHGGVGSILLGIKNNKKVVAAARLKKFGEHTNDHQKQIIKEFVDRGYIVELNQFDKLNQTIEQAKKMKSKKFQSNTNRFVKNIENYIEEDNHTSWFNHFRELSSYGYQGVILTIINFFIFCLLYTKYNIYFNLFITYVITTIISILLNKLFDISYRGKVKYLLLIKVLELILNFDIIYICKNIFSYHLIYSKLGINILLMIINIIVIRFCFQGKNKNK